MFWRSNYISITCLLGILKWHLYKEPRWKALYEHRQKLTKKLDWLKHLNTTKFKQWPAKGKEKEQNSGMQGSEESKKKGEKKKTGFGKKD